MLTMAAWTPGHSFWTKKQTPGSTANSVCMRVFSLIRSLLKPLKGCFWRIFQISLELIVLCLAVETAVTTLNGGECKTNQCMNDTDPCNEPPFILYTLHTTQSAFTLQFLPATHSFTQAHNGGGAATPLYQAH